jgi:hypothetical protein
MNYTYAVMRNGLLLDRTLTRARAAKIAAGYAGAVVVVALFTSGCAGPSRHVVGSVPCDNDNCGKRPGVDK